MSLIIVIGSLLSYFAFDFYDTSLISAKVIFLILSICVSVASFYVILAVSKVPVQSRLPGALWGAIPWNSLQLWQLAYIGFLFIPIEIILSGLLLGFRTGWVIRRAMLAALLVRVAVFSIYFLIRLEIIRKLMTSGAG